MSAGVADQYFTLRGHIHIHTHPQSRMNHLVSHGDFSALYGSLPITSRRRQIKRNSDSPGSKGR